jgi:hypothetical protein
MELRPPSSNDEVDEEIGCEKRKTNPFIARLVRDESPRTRHFVSNPRYE